MQMARTYNELKETYKINHTGLRAYKDGEWVLINPDDYDIIVEHAGHGYGTTQYRIIKNKPGLSDDELAEICDRGGYNFGHRREGGKLLVYID